MDENSDKIACRAVNDCNTAVRFEYTVTDTETGENVLSGKEKGEADGVTTLAELDKPSRNKVYRIDWRIKDDDIYGMDLCGANHYVYFKDTIDFEWYKKQAGTIENLPPFK